MFDFLFFPLPVFLMAAARQHSGGGICHDRRLKEPGKKTGEQNFTFLDMTKMTTGCHLLIDKVECPDYLSLVRAFIIKDNEWKAARK